MFSTDNIWDLAAYESGLESCTDNPTTTDKVENDFVAAGQCTAAECPDSNSGSESGSDTGAVDSSGDSGGQGFDCSPFSGLSYTQTIISRSQVDRTVVVERGLADALLSQPYESLYFCGKALINSAMRIHTIDQGSPLRDIGLAPDDTITQACSNGACSTVSLGIFDILAGPLEFGGDVELHIERGETTFVYTLQIRPPV